MIRPPLTSSLWPMGHGLVLTGVTVSKGKGVFQMRAARDGMQQEPGTSCSIEKWEACEGVAPLTIVFDNIAALEQHIATMGRLLELMKAEQP